LHFSAIFLKISLQIKKKGLFLRCENTEKLFYSQFYSHVATLNA